MLRKLLLGGAAALLFAVPAFAAEPASENQKILDELRDLKKSVNDRMDQLDRSIRDAQSRAASLDEKLYRLQRDALTTDDVRPFKNQVEQLLRDLAALRGEVGGVRQSMKPAPDSANISRSPIPAGSAIFRIRNELGPINLELNGTTYLVFPGVTDFTVPAGTVSYHVINSDRPPRTETVTGGTTREIRIYPKI